MNRATNEQWWVVDNYGMNFIVTNKDPRWGAAAGPFDTQKEAEEWAKEETDLPISK